MAGDSTATIGVPTTAPDALSTPTGVRLKLRELGCPDRIATDLDQGPGAGWADVSTPGILAWLKLATSVDGLAKLSISIRDLKARVHAGAPVRTVGATGTHRGTPAQKAESQKFKSHKQRLREMTNKYNTAVAQIREDVSALTRIYGEAALEGIRTPPELITRENLKDPAWLPPDAGLVTGSLRAAAEVVTCWREFCSHRDEYGPVGAARAQAIVDLFAKQAESLRIRIVACQRIVVAATASDISAAVAIKDGAEELRLGAGVSDAQRARRRHLCHAMCTPADEAVTVLAEAAVSEPLSEPRAYFLLQVIVGLVTRLERSLEWAERNRETAQIARDLFYHETT